MRSRDELQAQRRVKSAYRSQELDDHSRLIISFPAPDLLETNQMLAKLAQTESVQFVIVERIHDILRQCRHL